MPRASCPTLLMAEQVDDGMRLADTWVGSADGSPKSQARLVERIPGSGAVGGRGHLLLITLLL